MRRTRKKMIFDKHLAGKGRAEAVSPSLREQRGRRYNACRWNPPAPRQERGTPRPGHAARAGWNSVKKGTFNVLDIVTARSCGCRRQRINLGRRCLVLWDVEVPR